MAQKPLPASVDAYLAILRARLAYLDLDWSVVAGELGMTRQNLRKKLDRLDRIENRESFLASLGKIIGLSGKAIHSQARDAAADRTRLRLSRKA